MPWYHVETPVRGFVSGMVLAPSPEEAIAYAYRIGVKRFGYISANHALEFDRGTPATATLTEDK